MAAKKSVNAKSINAWQDDPMSGLLVIQRPVPDLSKKPLAFRITGKQYVAGLHATGTPEFRFWTAAEALRRGGDFWAPLLGVSEWEVGAVLPVGLDEGVDLNAYYDRKELNFFHQDVNGVTYYSGESPDVVCHEMGHACLDSHRPELWDTPFIEAGAFHESFGDQSAMLSQLQLKTVRQAALAGLKNHKASQLSRLAEQLGFAIRQVAPTAVDKDCLRNAYNTLEYVNPQTLPNSAPATQLCAEVHSFSRIFTGAFYDILCGMLKLQSKTPGDADVVKVVQDYAKLLLTATTNAPVQPDFFSQVAAHMIDADTASGGRYKSILTSVFVARKIIPKAVVQTLLAHTGRLPTKNVFGMATTNEPPTKSIVQKVVLDGKEFGMGDKSLIVHAPIERKPFLMVAAALSHEKIDSAVVEEATRKFVQMLFEHDRVDKTPREKRRLKPVEPPTHATLKRTHELIKTPEGIRLVRRLFHCGCHV
jgi:hypothetical protein